MNTLFKDYKMEIDPVTSNFIKFVPLIKIILHKYYYSDKDSLLNAFSCLREGCEVTDIVYNHVSRNFVMKIPRGKLTKIQKTLQKNYEKNHIVYTINDYFYDIIAEAFNKFFLLDT